MTTKNIFPSFSSSIYFYYHFIPDFQKHPPSAIFVFPIIVIFYSVVSTQRTNQPLKTNQNPIKLYPKRKKKTKPCRTFSSLLEISSIKVSDKVNKYINRQIDAQINLHLANNSLNYELYVVVYKPCSSVN